MTNLTEKNGTFSNSLLIRQSEIDQCTNASEVRKIVEKIIKEDTSLKPGAVKYGKNLLVKLNKVDDLLSAWRIVYNCILAGDNCGCYWSSAASNRQRM